MPCAYIPADSQKGSNNLNYNGNYNGNYAITKSKNPPKMKIYNETYTAHNKTTPPTNHEKDIQKLTRIHALSLNQNTITHERSAITHDRE